MAVGKSASTSSSSPVSPVGSAPHDVGVFVVSSDDQAVLLFAESVLTSRCMEDAGFTYEALDYGVVLDRMQQSADDAQREQFPYVSTLEGLPYANRSEGTPSDPNEAYIRSLDDGTRAVYGDALQGDIQDRVEVVVLGSTTGTPRGGCLSEARTALYGSLEDALTSLILSGNIAPAAHARTRSDPAVLEAMGSWARCMAGVGFDFADFGAARAAATARPDDAERIARVDGECTAGSDLATTYAAAFERARSSIVDANIGQFEASRAARSGAVERAQQLLIGG